MRVESAETKGNTAGRRQATQGNFIFTFMAQFWGVGKGEGMAEGRWAVSKVIKDNVVSIEKIKTTIPN